MSKEDLIKNLEIHLFINELGEIKLKDHSNIVIPKNPKNQSETLKDDIRRTKKLIKTLEKFNQKQKSKESEDLLENNKKMLKDLEDKGVASVAQVLELVAVPEMYLPVKITQGLMALSLKRKAHLGFFAPEDAAEAQEIARPRAL
jgi:hypothetical protein